MVKKTAAPDEISQALALREAGYTALAISQRLGISVRSLQRHFSETKTRKGAIKADLLRRAKDDLLSRITSDETIKEEAARLVADDLAHSVHLRDLILAASEQMKATCLRDAVQVMRAAAAYSTAIKNTSDIIRRSLRLEERDDAADELPELVVTELTHAEIEQLRSTQQENESTPGDDVDADVEVEVDVEVDDDVVMA